MMRGVATAVVVATGWADFRHSPSWPGMQDFVGSIIGDINARRGQIRTQEMRGNATVVRAYVPLANMFGYVSQLRSMSTGRASYTMQFAHYADVPRNVAEEVKAKYA